MRRVFAVLGAVAMVALAVVARDAIDDDGGDDSARSDDGELVLACDPELKDICAQVPDATVEVMAAADASAALVAGELDDVDAWLTSSAWNEVTAGRAGGAPGDAVRVATSPAVVVVSPERAPALRASCTDRSIWRCLGDDAGTPWADLGGQAAWGDLRTGLPDADTSTGLGVLVAVAVGYFDDDGFAANDFEGPAFRSWLDGLADASGSGDADPAATLVRVQGSYSAAGTTGARASAISRPLEQIEVRPAADVVLVLVDLGGAGDHTADQLRDALAETGWLTAVGAPTPVLKPGVVGALHDLWKDVAR